jgi:exopolyphosphatase/pppGpp-phosphohydrolase
VWRAELPKRKEIESAALLRLRLWASLLDPDFKHSTHVSRLALQLYDGLAANGRPAARQPRDRAVLGVAALLHDVGRSKDEKAHHKTSYRMIRRLVPPLGWPRQDLLMAGIVARYHRGALPGAGQKALQGLSPSQRKEILRSSAILRLADAFDASRDGRIRRLAVRAENGFLLITAQGYSARDNIAEAIAAARHMLETFYRRPVIVRPMSAVRAKATSRKARKQSPRTQGNSGRETRR